MFNGELARSEAVAPTGFLKEHRVAAGEPAASRAPNEASLVPQAVFALVVVVVAWRKGCDAVPFALALVSLAAEQVVPQTGEA